MRFFEFVAKPLFLIFLGSVPDDLTLQGRVENEFQQFKVGSIQSTINQSINQSI